MLRDPRGVVKYQRATHSKAEVERLMAYRLSVRAASDKRKALSGIGHARILVPAYHVLGIPLGTSLVFVGGAEVVVGVWCFFSRAEPPLKNGGYSRPPPYSRQKGAWATRPNVVGYGLDSPAQP
jgi:hypothetical protein